MNMKDMKECFTPHALAHNLLGLGLGVVLTNLVMSLYGSTGLWVGVGLVVLALLWDMSMKKK